jgi:urease accessory protein
MDTITDSALCRLMTWLSPNFPVGAFAYSHGLEFAVEAGDIHNAETLINWVEGILIFGAGRVDGALFRAAFEAAEDQDDERLGEVVERASALRGTSEMALETNAQGAAFLKTLPRIWPHPRLIRWSRRLEQTGLVAAYPVAVGVACALAEIPLRPALVAYLNAFAGNLVSAVVRLVPLGQTDGQLALASLEKTVAEAASATLRRPLDDFSSAALSVDWMSVQHETQYTRLFRS